MKLKHLINLQQFAEENNISLFTEAVDTIIDMIDSMIDAENETRFSLGGYSAAMLPCATMKNVEYFLENYYTPKYMNEAIACVTTLSSMSEEEAKEHIYELLARGRSLESIIDEAYKIMAL